MQSFNAQMIKGRLTEYVQAITKASSKGGRGMYVCPLCGSGTGKNKDGAFSITADGLSWKCFSCGEGGDIFDLIGKVEGITEYRQQVERAAQIFNFSLDDPRPAYTTRRQEPEEKTDYTDFFLQAAKHITETDYHRGISLETLQRFKVGYMAEWRHPKASPYAPASPRLIVPISKYGYMARDTRADGDIPKESQQYKKQRTKNAGIFNAKALQQAGQPVYIVEGELDALSIEDVGGAAVALGGTSGRDQLLEACKAQKPAQPLIIAMDNDAAGEKAQKQLTDGLQALQVPFWAFNPAKGYKDANEALQADREAFKQAVQAGKNPQASEEAARAEYLETSAAAHLKSFFDGVDRHADTPFIPTGFKHLDKALDGGLYEGLYIFGAASSVGKTTFAVQLADQIAQSGRDVLFFSLEQRRKELMAKSISRHTYMIADGMKQPHLAKSVRGITTGSKYADYSETEKEIIKQAVRNYGSYAGHVFIHEGLEAAIKGKEIGVEYIRETVMQHISITECKQPVVIVDYLQILSPADPRMTDKQNADKAITKLKILAGEFGIPVLAISSFNRQSYNDEVEMTAFKESGGIEYGADVAWGLEFLIERGEKKNVSAQIKAARKQAVRTITLTILKNRNGEVGATIPFTQYAKYNYYLNALE